MSCPVSFQLFRVWPQFAYHVQIASYLGGCPICYSLLVVGSWSIVAAVVGSCYTLIEGSLWGMAVGVRIRTVVGLGDKQKLASVLGVALAGDASCAPAVL